MKHVHAWMLCVGLLGLAGCGAPSGSPSPDDEGSVEAPNTPVSGSGSDTQVTAAAGGPLSAWIADCHYVSATGGSITCTGAVSGGTSPYTYWWKKDSGAWTQGSLTQGFTCTSSCTFYFKARDAMSAWGEESPVTCHSFDRQCYWAW